MVRAVVFALRQHADCVREDRSEVRDVCRALLLIGFDAQLESLTVFPPTHLHNQASTAHPKDDSAECAEVEATILKATYRATDLFEAKLHRSLTRVASNHDRVVVVANKAEDFLIGIVDAFARLEEKQDPQWDIDEFVIGRSRGLAKSVELHERDFNI